jgi:hypothetical protein
MDALRVRGWLVGQALGSSKRPVEPPPNGQAIDQADGPPYAMLRVDDVANSGLSA